LSYCRILPLPGVPARRLRHSIQRARRVKVRRNRRRWAKSSGPPREWSVTIMTSLMVAA